MNREENEEGHYQKKLSETKKLWVSQLGWFDIRTARLTAKILRDLQSMIIKMIFVMALFKTTIFDM